MLRKAHGQAAKYGALVVAETAPPDELPAGVPADARETSPSDRGEGGRFARGNKTSAAGGKSKAGKTRLASQLGLTSLAASDAFAPYKGSAEAFRRAHVASLAATVGGGHCGTGPSSIVASAALALAASRYLYDTANGDPALMAQAARLADSSRNALLTAHELCAREAEARKASAPKARKFFVEGDK